MVIQKIRNTTKNQKTLLGIMVAVLIFGLLASYFIWQSPDFGTNQGQMTPEQIDKQLEAYDDSIAKAKEELAAKPDDYSLLVNLASLYQAQGELLTEAERYNDVLTSYANVIEYYTRALANKPAELNASAEADIYAKIANANWVIGYNEGADEAFAKALALDPTNWSINYLHVMYLFSANGVDAALSAAKDYQALVKDDAELSKNADALVNQIQQVKDSRDQENQNQDNQDSEQENQ
ncbi:MAG: hypothetical protein HFI72_05995 [Peptococcaceae bacterium]|nr:hypothetical protein [Peptococcaceae bacterium]